MLRQVLGALAKSGCTLSLEKGFFAEPELKPLGHYISRLGLSTQAEKTEATRRRLEMPRTLKDLETGLGLMGYYRSFIAQVYLSTPN